MSNWRLEELRIYRIGYGDNKGKYTAKIEFVNGSKDAFTFSLDEEQTQKYIDLISEIVIDSANHLGKNLSKSLLPELLGEAKEIDD